MKLILNLIIYALTILIIAAIVPGISVASFWTALIVAIVLGIINIILKPILVILTLPINIITLGLFIFIIDALLFWLTAAIVKGFNVAGFVPALVGALILAFVHVIVNHLERSKTVWPSSTN